MEVGGGDRSGKGECRAREGSNDSARHRFTQKMLDISDWRGREGPIEPKRDQRPDIIFSASGWPASAPNHSVQKSANDESTSVLFIERRSAALVRLSERCGDLRQRSRALPTDELGEHGRDGDKKRVSFKFVPSEGTWIRWEIVSPSKRRRSPAPEQGWYKESRWASGRIRHTKHFHNVSQLLHLHIRSRHGGKAVNQAGEERDAELPTPWIIPVTDGPPY